MQKESNYKFTYMHVEAKYRIYRIVCKPLFFNFFNKYYVYINDKLFYFILFRISFFNYSLVQLKTVSRMSIMKEIAIKKSLSLICSILVGNIWNNFKRIVMI